MQDATQSQRESAANLPNWHNAAAIYSASYSILTRMSRYHVAIVKGRAVPSDAMREFVDALNRGEERPIRQLVAQWGDETEQLAIH